MVIACGDSGAPAQVPRMPGRVHCGRHWIESQRCDLVLPSNVDDRGLPDGHHLECALAGEEDWELDVVTFREAEFPSQDVACHVSTLRFFLTLEQRSKHRRRFSDFSSIWVHR
jgi:hypothetical protein